MNQIETGNFVKRPYGVSVYKVAEIVETEISSYAVLIDNLGFAVDTVNVRDLKRVNVEVRMVEMWVEI